MDGPKDQRVSGQPGAAAVCNLWEEEAHGGPVFPSFQPSIDTKAGSARRSGPKIQVRSTVKDTGPRMARINANGEEKQTGGRRSVGAQISAANAAS